MVLPPNPPTCQARLNDGGYVCSRPVAHQHGHVYISRDVADRHNDSEARDE